MLYETVEMIVADRARLHAEVERIKKELDAEREVSRVYHDLAEQLGKKASDARRTAMEEAAGIAEERQRQASAEHKRMLDAGLETDRDSEDEMNGLAGEAHAAKEIATAIRAAAKEER